MMSLSREIGNAMIVATKTLFCERKQWAMARNGKDFKFDVVIGTGKRTCHISSRQKDSFKIIYGLEMIQDQLNAKTACSWLTFRELIDFKFCSKDNISTLTLLSHVVLHEFGHWVQTIMGARYENSVHNEEFYKILSKAYRNNVNQQIEGLILKQIKNDDVIQRIKAPFEKLKYHVKSDFRLNERVKFDFNGAVYEGHIKKKNDRTCVVSCTIIGRPSQIKCFYTSLEKIEKAKIIDR